MLLDRQASNSELGILLASIVKWMYDGLPLRDIDTNIDLVIGKAEYGSAYSPPDAIHPRAYCRVMDPWGIVVIGGTENATQGAGVVTGYYSVNPFGATPPINNFALGLVSDLLANQIFRQASLMPQVVFAGHSLGGAMAQILHVGRLQEGPSGLIKSTTFGQPKTGLTEFAQRFSGQQTARWMNSDDPVPIVPPRWEECPIFYSPFTPSQWIDFSRFVHTAGGWDLTAGGVRTESVLPTQAIVDPSLNLGAWLYNLTRGQINPHSIEVYLQRLRLLNPTTAINPGPDAQGGPMELANPVRRRGIARQQDSQERAIAERAYVQQTIDYNTPPTLFFRRIKNGNAWYVLFGEQVVCCGPSRRRAQAVCDSGNAFLKRLLRQGVVDPTQMLAQFNSWFSTASDPASTIKPTLLSVPPHPVS